MTVDRGRADGPDPIVSMLTGSLFTHVGYALAVLGVADVLGDRTVHLSRVAETTGAHPDPLLQLMRTGTGLGLFIEAPPRFFALTPAGQRMRTDHPHSRHTSFVRSVERNGPLLAELLHTVRTGLPAWEKVHGRPIFEETGERYPLQLHDSPALIDLLTGYDLSGVRTVVDVAGGDGRVLDALLRRHPDLRGVLFDLPAAVHRAREMVRPDAADRCEFVEGSFFDAVPGGGDLYLITRVLHNWNDNAVTAILGAVRAAMPADARLLVAERLAARPEREPMTLFLNMLMLLLNGGHERTEEEYRDLLERAGFAVADVRYPTAATGTPAESLLEGVPK